MTEEELTQQEFLYRVLTRRYHGECWRRGDRVVQSEMEEYMLEYGVTREYLEYRNKQEVTPE